MKFIIESKHFNKIEISKIKKTHNIINNNIIFDFYDIKFKKKIESYCSPNISEYQIYNSINNINNNSFKILKKNINTSKLNIKLLNYQIENLKWMKYIENNYNSSIFSFQDYTNCYFVKFKGGCLIDDSGTGKTTTMISYMIINHKPKKYNLIICSKNNITEIIKLINLNNKKYVILEHLNNNILLTDFVIVSYKTLDKYKKFNETNNLKNNLKNILWERIYVDNIHELSFNINFLQSKYKWCCSSSYFLSENNIFFNIINFLTNSKDNSNININLNFINYVNEIIFRRNKKTTYEKELKLPNIIKKEVWLNMHDIESYFYKNLLFENKNINDIKLFCSLSNNNQDYINMKFNSDIDIINNQDNCIICYENKINCKLKCGHFFCFKCLIKNLFINKNCPLCRNNILSSDINIKTDTKKFSKLDYLLMLLKSIKNSKLVIFTQFEQSFENLKNIFNYNNIKFSSVKDNFNLDANIILISKKYINKLTNLQNIDYIIFLEPLYYDILNKNKIENQIIGKTYNMGQTKILNIITLVINNTIDQKFLN